MRRQDVWNTAPCVLAMMLVASASYADKGGKRPGNPGNHDFAAQFCLDMNDGGGYAFESDGKQSYNGPYCHDPDERVSVLGGDIGFNFQTFTRKSGTPRRQVQVNFPGGSVVAKHDFDGRETLFVSGLWNMTVRFDKEDGGLQWSTIPVGQFGTVPIMIGISNAAGDGIGMAAGPNVDPLTSGDLKGNPCVQFTDNAVVTHIAEDLWTVESFPGNPTVCLWDKNMGFRDQTGVPVSMPYKFSLTVQ